MSNARIKNVWLPLVEGELLIGKWMGEKGGYEIFMDCVNEEGVDMPESTIRVFAGVVLKDTLNKNCTQGHAYGVRFDGMRKSAAGREYQLWTVEEA